MEDEFDCFTEEDLQEELSNLELDMFQKELMEELENDFINHFAWLNKKQSN